MTLTLEVGEEQLQRYKMQAEARGVSLEQWLVDVADSCVLAPEPPQQEESYVHLQQTDPKEWIRRVREWAESHDPSLPPLSDYAMSRDSIYD